MVTQTYASGIDARLSRVSGLSLNSPNGTRYSLAAYRRLGMDTFAVVDYPAVDIHLDRTWSPSERKRRTNGWFVDDALRACCLTKGCKTK